MSLGITIVKAICTIENIDPSQATTKLGFTLHDYIDSDPLDRLFTDGLGDADATLELVFDEYYIVIENSGRIQIKLRG